MPQFGPVLTHLQDVEPASITWLWPGRIPRGKLSLLVGDPGLGKSFISLDMTARVTSGSDWPDGGKQSPNNVVILTAEDDLADTVRPRIDKLHGDPSNVWVLEAVKNGENRERHFNLLADLEVLEKVILDTKAVFVVIDPLSAYLGFVDSYKDSEIRSVLAPLSKLAERTLCAIMGVMHLNKDSQKAAVYRASGSIAFVGMARVAYMVVVDPNDPLKRYMAPLKINICAPPPVLSYTTKDGNFAWTGLDEKINLQNYLIGVGDENMESVENADEFLQSYLTEGMRTSEDVFQAAKMNGVSRRALFNSKKSLGVTVRRQGFGASGIWTWSLG